MGDVVIDVPPESQVHKQVVRKRVEAREIRMDPAVHLHYVEVAEPDMHDPSGDLERLERALRDQWGFEDVTIDLPVLQMLQPALRKGSGASPSLHQGSDAGGRGSCRSGPGLLRGLDLRPRHRPRVDNHRRAPLRPASRARCWRRRA
jgi:uncharacterized 2Fe-2S/4Fe-4S cluster protein (DUF4445 family)